MSLNPSYIVTKKVAQPEWLSLQDAKDQLRVRHNFEDNYINGCVKAAVDEAEGYMSRFLDQRDVVITMEGFPTELAVEYGPVLGGAFTVSYFDTTGTEVALPDAYLISEEYGKKPSFKLKPGIDLPGVDFRSDAVSFTYVAGIALDELPMAIKKALQLIVSEMYEFRNDRSEIMSTRAKSLMRAYKVWD